MQFCKEYNAATQDKIGTVIPVEITVFEVSPSISLLSKDALLCLSQLGNLCPALAAG